ncbi:uncharacterized protein [Tenebrio molitor]|uniref:uncharacterized protein n=1 Tax=Tenebrio molitor TaxID=7067 RepID=UPI00362483D8
MQSAFVLFLLVVSCAAVKLPPNFQKCNRKQPDLKECVFKAAQNGISQLTRAYDEVKIINVHPFELPALTIGAGKGPVAVDQKFKNCKLDGFHLMKLDDFEFDLEGKKVMIVGTFPEVTMKCEYELDGKILLVPIQGTGPSTIVLKNVKAKGVFPYEEFKKKDKTFVKFVSSSLTIDPELVSFNFENLFNGDKKLGDNVNQVLNDNWKEVFDDVIQDYIEVFNQILISVFNNLFSKVSLEDAFDSPDFQKCNRRQSDLKKCVLKSAQDGISQLTRAYDEVNIPNVHPLEVAELTIEAGSGPVAFDQKFKQCKLDGFHKMKLDQFEFDFEGKTLTVAGVVPKIMVECQYEFDGKILLLPIKGKGPSTIVLENMKVSGLFDYEEKMKKGKTFIRFVSSDIHVDPGLAWFNFENLFNGDKQLGDNVNQVINDNWKEVFDDVKSSYIQVINRVCTELLNNFFGKVSVGEAFD